MSNKIICYNCFHERSEGTICPRCGYEAGSLDGKYPLALPEGSILAGQYIVGRVLGQGGFGITYIAQDHQSGERVAIKEYLPDAYASRKTGTCTVAPYPGEKQQFFDFGRKQFLREAKMLGSLRKIENIVDVYKYFAENGTAYMVTGYINGPGLNKYIKRYGELSAREADELLLPIAKALAAVHKKGLVHRDIAPDNILVENHHGDAGARLIDFGAARYTTNEKSRTLDVVLKSGFSPVEQYSANGKQGPYTDVYAFCATYYYAITGIVPPASIDRLTGERIDLPSALGANISPAEEAVLMKGLSVPAKDRYQTMDELYQAFLAAGYVPKQESVSGKNTVSGTAAQTASGSGTGTENARKPPIDRLSEKFEKFNLIWAAAAILCVVVVAAAMVIILSI